MASISVTSSMASSRSDPNAANSANNANMYRVGDYVFFENASAVPYAIRRIEELNKTANGNVEARVMCFFRRSELPANLLTQADRHHWGDSAVPKPGDKSEKANEDKDSDSDSDDEPVMSKEAREKEAERNQFKLREVFLSRQVENLPATLIRGKCSVTLLSEVETAESYVGREDAFFYALVYDPHQKTLVADRGEIRIGSSYQATVPALLKNPKKEDDRDSKDLEEPLWIPDSILSQTEVEKFLIVARSVGTFARALDCSSSVKQPSLHMSAAAASRDVTLFHAYNVLHRSDYDLAEAIKAMVPASGPTLCRDEMEDWSAAEANLFEEAMEKYGKDFNDIRKDFLPWKTMKNIIEYFFMWKTTDRYVQQKRLKAIESESKLKQVYVPAYTNKSTRLTGPNGEIIIRGKDIDAFPNMPKYSWQLYKKYGKFVTAKLIDDSFIFEKSSFANVTAARLAQLRPGLIIEPGSPAGGGMPTGPGGKAASGKTRAAFFLRTTPVTRASRQLCRHISKLTKACRRPGKPIDIKAIKAETLAKLPSLTEKQLRAYNAFKTTERPPMSTVVKKLGQKDDSVHQWLVLTPKEQLPKPSKIAFPRPSKRPDGSYIYERVPNALERTGTPSAAAGGTPSAASGTTATPTAASGGTTTTTGGSPSSLLYNKKRAYEGGDLSSQMPKVQRTAPANTQIAQVQGKQRTATLTRMSSMGGNGKQGISWMDAPDDVFFKATGATKKIRKRYPVLLLRRAARKPFKKIL